MSEEEWIHFIMCMKTAEDFLKLSDYCDQLPEKKSVMRYGPKPSEYSAIDIAGSVERDYRDCVPIVMDGVIGYRSLHIYDIKIALALVKIADGWYEYFIHDADFMYHNEESATKNMQMRFCIDQPGAIIHFDMRNIMPVEDGFIMRDNYTFIQKSKKWVYNIYHDINKPIHLTIKTKEPLKFPLIVKVECEIVTFVSTTLTLAMEQLKRRHSITKNGGYWKNVKFNAEWTSEPYKIRQD